METIFRICLAVAGIINFLPSLLAIAPSKINASYGIEVINDNYELLLRHRAVLFGIVGGMMLYSAITKSNYNLTVTVGMISMVSFVVLYQFGNGSINQELTKVFKIDVVAILILVTGYLLFKFK